MSGAKVVVYAGPTIAPDEVNSVLPDAQVLAPLARGDLLAGEWNPGDTAVVIDGYFREQRSVGHKEVLWLLSQGVRVIGAASMGALRAAELSPYGMQGVGVVYDMYASEQIDGDDEVGVLHGPAAMGYPPQTVALVSLRYGCREGMAANLISEPAGRRVIEAAKALPFTHRTWQEIASKLGEPDRAVLALLKENIVSGAWDLKRLDALAALRATSTPDAAGTQAPVIDPAVLTGISHNWLLARRSLQEHGPGKWISDLHVLDAARLFDAEYPQLHQKALFTLLDGLAASRGMTVQSYAEAKLGVEADSPLPAQLACWLAPAELATLTPEQQHRLVMLRVWPIWQSPDWRPAVLAELRGADRWHEWCEIVSQADEAAEEARYRLVVPAPAVCGTLFLRHWRRPETSAQVEMARRGFDSHEDLGRAVKRFFAYDVRRGKGRATVAAAGGGASGVS